MRTRPTTELSPRLLPQRLPIRWASSTRPLVRVLLGRQSQVRGTRPLGLHRVTVLVYGMLGESRIPFSVSISSLGVYCLCLVAPLLLGSFQPFGTRLQLTRSTL